MPVLDIGGWRSDDEISKSVACAKVLSAMCFHDDPGKMKDYVISTVFQYMEQFNKKSKIYYELIQKYLEPLGGIKNLNNAPSKAEMKKLVARRFRDGQIAGTILFEVWMFWWMTPVQSKIESMSVKKAKWRVEKELSNTEEPLKARMISAIWERTKPVVHLWAAFHQNLIEDKTRTGETPRFNIYCPESLPDLLASAEFYRMFGLSHVPHGQKVSILSGVDMWIPPDSFLIPDRDYNFSRHPSQENKEKSNDLRKSFLEDYQEIFKKYKAPANARD
jgi:hypothetical protein